MTVRPESPPTYNGPVLRWAGELAQAVSKQHKCSHHRMLTAERPEPWERLARGNLVSQMVGHGWQLSTIERHFGMPHGAAQKALDVWKGRLVRVIPSPEPIVKPSRPEDNPRAASWQESDAPRCTVMNTRGQACRMPQVEGKSVCAWHARASAPKAKLRVIEGGAVQPMKAARFERCTWRRSHGARCVLKAQERGLCHGHLAIAKKREESEG